MKMENRVVQTYCFRGDGGIFKSAQLTGGNVELESAWDGKHTLDVMWQAMKIGENSKVRNTEKEHLDCEHIS